MSIAGNLIEIKSHIPSYVKLIAVSKTQPPEAIMQVYFAGHKIFGENKVQEMINKYEQLPKDIEWHFIGHLQTNKVKYITPFVSLIHSVDSLKLLKEINKEAKNNNRIVNCLLQIHIAREETKFGFNFEAAETLLLSEELKQLKNISISGLMGMATFTEDTMQIRKEFKSLSEFFNAMKIQSPELTILSIGMSSDYSIAIEEGSNMIRVGSAIFGERSYRK